MEKTCKHMHADGILCSFFFSSHKRRANGRGDGQFCPHLHTMQEELDGLALCEAGFNANESRCGNISLCEVEETPHSHISIYP